jgi:hypothetical protein
MEAVVARAQEPGAGGAAQQLVLALAQIPGWDEKNFQVGGFSFEINKIKMRVKCGQPDRMYKQEQQQLICMQLQDFEY